jgi:hypothetical protein
MQIMGYSAKPKVKVNPTEDKSCLRNAVIRLVMHKFFETFIMCCILGNTLVLMITWYGQDPIVGRITDYINYVFMAIFTLEAVLKIFAMHTAYFKDSWNNFDFVVVVTTIVILIIGFFNVGNFAIQATILRSLRIGRLLRIMRFAKKLQIIFNTLLEAGPSIISLGFLLLLVMFMYAIIGMKMFGFVNNSDQTTANYHVHFQNFITAFLLLFRSATGEAWDSIMIDMARPRSILFQCV